MLYSRAADKQKITAQEALHAGQELKTDDLAKEYTDACAMAALWQTLIAAAQREDARLSKLAAPKA